MPGADIIHAGAALKSWLKSFLSSCMRLLKIPKIWRRALVVAIPRPKNPPGEAKSIDLSVFAICPL